MVKYIIVNYYIIYMNYTKILLNILMPTNRGIDNKKLNKITIDKYPNIYNYIMNIYQDSSSIKETIKRLNLHIDIKPLCPTCGKPVNFVGIQSKMFSKYCSNSCSAKAQRANPELEKKYKETCLQKYGVDNPAKAKINIEKAKLTCQIKYGGNSPMHSVNVRKTKYKHHKENHTFNTSKNEIESFNMLKQYYQDTVYQYMSNLYPYNCDFYIPSLDLYIECNYHWTHGGHPYNKTIDYKELIKWNNKSLNSNFYKNAIETWTIRDVEKRETAKQNNLNYIEFFTINELKQWLNKKHTTQMN